MEKTFLTCTGCGTPVPDDAAHCPFCGVVVDHQMLRGVAIAADASKLEVTGAAVVLGAAEGEQRVCNHCGSRVPLDVTDVCPFCQTKIVIEALHAPSLVVSGGSVEIRGGASLVIGGDGRAAPQPRRGAMLSLGRVVPLDEKLVKAIEQGKMPRAEKRLAEGWVLSGVDPAGRTSIGLALDLSREGLLDWMLARGAVIDEVDAKGDTPLLRAVRRGQADHVALLLAKGARWDVSGSDGCSALEVAERGKHPEVAELLRARRRART